MRIITYALASPELPPFGEECVARIICHHPAHGKRKARDDWHPVIFHAGTPEAARAAAQAWWDAELDRQARVQAAREAAGERLAQTRKTKEAAQ